MEVGHGFRGLNADARARITRPAATPRADVDARLSGMARARPPSNPGPP
eukprot:CAMPEP_0204202580 /NCGR_PEP_ID=MMETSP0361-20130328/68323_1 /ASSEMBLY_ACC=CAM_ASM_000343 /TAXON_ID=268821 /ORGANISM="Scrippsiella Hangoei, Strain SHTV-5" /LENGTH=48 /DNA_ID= /DNA_START= /DNA_END= /DNA_ORIENTATION=